MSQFNFPGNSTSTALLIAAILPRILNAIKGEGPVVIVQNHGVSTGTLDGKIQDSADNASFADVAGPQVAGVTLTGCKKSV